MQSQENRIIDAANILTVISTIQRVLHKFITATTTYSILLLQELFKMGLRSAKCLSTARLDGKTAVITGCNTGIGKVTAKDFFKRGAKVIMACRNIQAAKSARVDIEKECTDCPNCGELCVTELDLSSLESVRKCAKDLLLTERKINILINNAGVMMCPYSKTAEGFEMQFGTNHLGHFLFTLLLLPKIIESTPARIVNLSSIAHIGGKIDFDDINWKKKTYSSLGAYEQSKLANVLFTKELSRKLIENNVNDVKVYSVHPGVVATDLGRHFNTLVPGLKWIWYTFGRRFLKTPEEGAQTTIYCAVDEKCKNETGLYYSDCAVNEPSNNAKNMETAKKLWEVSCKLVDLEDNNNPFKTVN